MPDYSTITESIAVEKFKNDVVWIVAGNNVLSTFPKDCVVHFMWRKLS